MAAAQPPKGLSQSLSLPYATKLTKYNEAGRKEETLVYGSLPSYSLKQMLLIYKSVLIPKCNAFSSSMIALLLWL